MGITTNRNKPLWMGLDSYKETDSNMFFGRKEEILQLSNDIFHNIQTIIYGSSGTGKTSIIQAGIFKIARNNGYFPIYIRLSHDYSKVEPYYLQVINAIEAEAKNRKIDIERTTDYINKIGDSTICNSLWEYLHCNEFWTEDNYPVTPLIVIDQFEEIFTLGQDNSWTKDFFEQISDLCENKHPQYIKDYVNNRDNDHIRYIESVNYRFVISLREDFLARLEEQADNIPVLKRNRFSLQCINQKQALEIITKPSPNLVSKKVAIQIIERVTNKKYRKDFTLDNDSEISVEPSILSLFCSELDKKRQEQKSCFITEELIGLFGDNIIQNFYVDSLKEITKDKIDFLESRLLTDDGFRDSVALQNAINYGFTNADIKLLTDRRLIRIEEWDGTKRIEFTHDVLCKVASEHREERAQENELQKIRIEEEKKRQSLLEKQEQERTLRNIEYNRKKRATDHNVLTHKGRKLIDNALDFGENRCIFNVLGIDYLLNLAKFFSCIITNDFKDVKDSDFENQQVFSDPLLENSTCVLSFFKDEKRTQTIDGLYGVELKYNRQLITDVFFKGKKTLSDGSVSYEEPIYILGGFCGIHMDYDEYNREIRRTYLDESGNPIITQDGYSMIQTQYDKYSNPIEVRFYNFISSKVTPAKHNNGNYGFDSVFDKNGNEIERYFVDENGCHTTILSGVFGKRMQYDKDTFQLSSISNLNSEGKLLADKDGYVTVDIKYDDSHQQRFEYYKDENGDAWKSPDGTYGIVEILDDKNGLVISQNINKNGQFICNNNGVFRNVAKYNRCRKITELRNEDSNGNLLNVEGFSVQKYDYNEQNRILSLKVFDKDGNFILGKRYDYSKEGTHAIREYSLSESGIGRNTDFDVEGLEYNYNSDKDLPTLVIFINEHKQYKACNDGYNAIRSWEDEKGRTIKQLYYDIDGTPMSDKNDIYGVKIEYLDEHTTKHIYIDSDGNTIENNNGEAYTVTVNNELCTIQTSYNLKGEPHANDGWVYVCKEKKQLEFGHQEKLYVLNSNKEQIEIIRLRIADSEWGAVKCMYEIINYDEKGRPLSQYFTDEKNNIVGDSDGDSYTIWEYDDKNNIEVLSLYKINEELSFRIRSVKDDKHRIIEHVILDRNNHYAELERGYSGEIYEYKDEENLKIMTFINSQGKPCNNNEGFAHRYSWFDKEERVIAQKDVTIEGNIYGSIHFREYIDSERRECAYYLHQEDVQGNLVPNANGTFFEYFEDDEKGRTLKQLYLNADKIPMPDNEGDYGLCYEYDDKQNLTVIKCLDEEGNIHNNNQNYGIIHTYTNENGHVIKRMYFSADGNPVKLTMLLDCYGLSYEYINQHTMIIGYLDQNGSVKINQNGYAYREEHYNPENGAKQIFYYDVERNNIQSLEDKCKEYGYMTREEEDCKYIISLGKDGETTNNACGYAIRREVYEDGKIRFYQYLNADEEAIEDEVGDYGTEISYSDDGSTLRTISLDKNLKRHINNYGFCFRDEITDIVGDKILIWRDLDGNQVLPKERLTKKLKRMIQRFEIIEKPQPIFNCRQIGAIYSCVLGNVENNKYGKKYNLHDTYILLQYDEWCFGDDSDLLINSIEKSTKELKHVILLPVILIGSLLHSVGEIIELDIHNKEKIGIRFKDWKINKQTYEIILKQVQHISEQSLK